MTIVQSWLDSDVRTQVVKRHFPHYSDQHVEDTAAYVVEDCLIFDKDRDSFDDKTRFAGYVKRELMCCDAYANIIAELLSS